MTARPPASGPVTEGTLLADMPPARSVPAAEVAARVGESGRQLVVLDDDPTGTQTVADVPVLTTWGVDDLRWGLKQQAPALFVLTNTRSLSGPEAAARDREVAESLAAAARAEQRDVVVASRSDSTLRGHFPIEIDIIAEVLGPPDGVIVVPAYVEGGRLTVDSVHWVRTPDGFVPAAHSEFAADATFGYRSSDLREYVEEKSAGRWRAADVARITLRELRELRQPRAGPAAVTRRLIDAGGGVPIVVDVACDDDLRALALAVLDAEAAGRRFLYRVGPSFVRARAGLEARAPLTAGEIGANSDARTDAQAHGLVVVGSHVRQTTRQLEGLRAIGGITEVELDVAGVLDPGRRDGLVAGAVEQAASALRETDVVVATSRAVLTGADHDASLAIARAVSAAVVDVVKGVVAERRPAWVVAKGGITSSDVATEALGIRRAWARGTLLPGIVSLWEPEGAAAGIPYVVFAGNVGDEAALADVVATLRRS